MSFRGYYYSKNLPSVARSHSSILPGSTYEPDPDDGAEEPEDGTQEAERFTGSPPIANATMGDAAPAESATTAAIVAERVDQKTEGSEPGGGEDQVHGPVEEATAEREEPDQAKEDGQASDDFNVDEARSGPRVGMVVTVKVGADDASNNTGADELGEAKCGGDKTW